MNPANSFTQIFPPILTAARVGRCVPALLLALSGAVAAQAQTLEAPKSLVVGSASAVPAPAKAPWGRVVMVGASVTAGFTAAEPFGGTNTPRYRLSRYVDSALKAPHEPVRNFGSSMLFLQPEPMGQRQIQQALQAQPTLVIGVDFLFWFCYGNMPTNKTRLERFEKGLKLLETVPGPLVVGDIPDASAAANGMLSPAQIPSAEVLSAANRRLREWAKARPQVSLVPLTEIMKAAAANDAFTLRNHTWAKGQTSGLLQDDKLHSSPAGCVVLALAALDSFQAAHPEVPKDDVCWDPDEVLRITTRIPNGPTKLKIVPIPAS